MHKSSTYRFVSVFSLGLLMLVTPAFSLAAAPSTLIPCGFDTNSDGKVFGPGEECTFGDVITLAQNVINFLIFKIAAPLGAVMFAYAGFLYVTNRGNEGQVKQAHDIFLNVFWGLLVAIAAWVTVNFILEFFLGTGSTFNFLGP